MYGAGEHFRISFAGQAPILIFGLPSEATIYCGGVWWTYRELNSELSNANAILYRLTIGPLLIYQPTITL